MELAFICRRVHTELEGTAILSRSRGGTDSSNPPSSRGESCANPVLPAQGTCLRANARMRECANEDGSATTRLHRYGGIFGWLANAASHPAAPDWLRKAFEAWFTALIEVAWGKQRVMEIYLNVAEWGPGVFGAEAAARHYFHKPADALL
jgi:hypothetical protein